MLSSLQWMRTLIHLDLGIPFYTQLTDRVCLGCHVRLECKQNPVNKKT